MLDENGAGEGHGFEIRVNGTYCEVFTVYSQWVDGKTAREAIDKAMVKE